MEKKNFLNEIRGLGDSIHKYCIDYVSEKPNKLIRCTDSALSYDNIYCYLYDEYGDIEERRVVAISVFDNMLAVLPDCWDDYDAMSDEDLLECNEWRTVMGGDLIEGQTMLSIIDTINEY